MVKDKGVSQCQTLMPFCVSRAAQQCVCVGAVRWKSRPSFEMCWTKDEKRLGGIYLFSWQAWVQGDRRTSVFKCVCIYVYTPCILYLVYAQLALKCVNTHSKSCQDTEWHAHHSLSEYFHPMKLAVNTCPPLCSLLIILSDSRVTLYHLFDLRNLSNLISAQKLPLVPMFAQVMSCICTRCVSSRLRRWVGLLCIFKQIFS